MSADVDVKHEPRIVPPPPPPPPLHPPPPNTLLQPSSSASSAAAGTGVGPGAGAGAGSATAAYHHHHHHHHQQQHSHNPHHHHQQQHPPSAASITTNGADHYHHQQHHHPPPPSPNHGLSLHHLHPHDQQRSPLDPQHHPYAHQGQQQGQQQQQQQQQHHHQQQQQQQQPFAPASLSHQRPPPLPHDARALPEPVKHRHPSAGRDHPGSGRDVSKKRSPSSAVQSPGVEQLLAPPPPPPSLSLSQQQQHPPQPPPQPPPPPGGPNSSAPPTPSAPHPPRGPPAPPSSSSQPDHANRDMHYQPPYHHPSDPYGPRRYSMQQHDHPGPAQGGYMHPPETPYPHYSQEPDSTHLRRKAVRAAQACENCRQKKSKCDELRPECTSCQQSNLKCQYREVPPPKQEKSMQQVTDLLQSMSQSMTQNFDQLKARMGKMEELYQQWKPAVPFGPLPAAALGPDLLASQTPASGASNSGPPSGTTEFKQESNEDSKPGDAARPSSASSQQQQAAANAKSGDDGGDPRAAAAAAATTKQAPLSKLKVPDTQAHNLLWSWNSIRPFVQGVLKSSNDDYVLAAEESRGILKLYGNAPGPDRHRGLDGVGIDSPAAYSDFSEQSSGVNGESWGHAGTRLCNFAPVDRPSDMLPGGTNVRTGLLQLDRHTIDRLFLSYKEHLHVLHPFVNLDRVRQTIDKISAMSSVSSSVSSSSSSSSHTVFAVPDPATAASAPPTYDGRRADGTHGQKRRRTDHDTTMGEMPSPRIPYSQAYPPPATLERSPDMAILLLICALGRTCEEKGNLDISSAAVAEHFAVPESSAPSPLVPGLSSPASTTGRSASYPSAGGGPPRERKNRAPLNVETHPGLAYYAEAKEILGDMTGSHSMVYVQANLLAGVYMAQFVRILESYRSIHEACISCIILIKQLGVLTNPDGLDNYTRLTFWSCLQMESDILAELAFPKSGITDFEERFPLPVMGEEKVMLCYSAQITLRKILNQSTWYLYDGNHTLLNNPKRSLDQLQGMITYLDGWRSATARMAQAYGIAELEWSDDDEPATDINIARMRGKYYGARYIIHRPFLKHILNQEDFNGSSSGGSNAYGNPQAGQTATKAEDYHAIVKHAQTCVNAAVKSTYAFDGYRKKYGRLLVTNVFGTAHAQFGNTLVLSATARSHKFSWMVEKSKLDTLLSRTIDFFQPLARLSPTMTNDLKILYNTKRVLLADEEARATGSATAGGTTMPSSAAHSFQTSAPSSLSQSFPP